MSDRVREFLKAAASDKEWMSKQQSTSDKDEAISAALAKAAEIGVPLSREDFDMPEGELSEDELMVVTGAGRCACSVGGGGTSEDSPSCENAGFQDQVCWCVVYGEGWRYEWYSGEERPDGKRCECPVVGHGD